MSHTAKRRIEQVWQRRWVVVVITVLAVLLAAMYSLRAHATYAATSTLMLGGQSAEQDALMVLGYVTLFNDKATVTRLKADTEIPEDVDFEARTAAASPILIIEATADDPRVAQDASEKMAKVFRDDINRTQRAGAEEYAADLERQLSQVNPLTPDGQANDYYNNLRERMDSARSDLTNQIRELQPRAGVTESAPNTVFNLGTGAAGGLLLGILAALGLSTVSRRVTNSADLSEKCGMEALVELPSSDSDELMAVRQDHLRALANRLSLENLRKPTIVAVTDSRDTREAQAIAEALAELSAQQGHRTVLIYADDNPSPTEGAGFNDVLAYGNLVVDVLKDGSVESLKILPAGSSVADRYSLMTRERIRAVLDELRMEVEAVFIAAPSIAENTEGQLVCAAADATILAINKRSARADDINAAAETLAKAHEMLLGAVLIDTPRKKRSGSPAHPANTALSVRHRLTEHTTAAVNHHGSRAVE